VYLETFMDGFISRLARGDQAGLEEVLSIVEQTIRARR